MIQIQLKYEKHPAKKSYSHYFRKTRPMNRKPSNTPDSVLLPLVEPKNSLSSSLLCSSAFGTHFKHPSVWDNCEFPQADLDMLLFWPFQPLTYLSFSNFKWCLNYGCKSFFFYEGNSFIHFVLTISAWPMGLKYLLNEAINDHCSAGNF